MLQDWENGNAAKQPAYDQQSAPNLFTPVDYASRLQNSGRRRRSAAGSSYQPGSMYGAPTPSAPPMAAPEYEAPSYLQQQEWFPAQEWQPDQNAPVQAQEGVPYSAALFDHQPTAVMPSGWDVNAFAEQLVQDLWQDAPVEAPVWEEEPQEEEPVYYAAADIPLRDPFTPAQPREEKKPQKSPTKAETPKRQRKPIRLDMVLWAIAVALLTVSLVVGVPIVIEASRNEREVEAFHAGYLEENGVDVFHGAAKVDLLPEGQTYVPTATPSPTIYAPTPSPTPIIPISEAVVMGVAGDTLQQTGETPAPALRTRLTAYPKNPMCNIMESIRQMVSENGDVIGRLVIDGMVDEMVMQRNNTYYLTHNSIGITSESGAVFADESCSLRNPPENLLLRGQSGVPGKVFEPLWKYVSGGAAFASSHMTARLTTLYEEERYVLFAVVVANRDPASSQYFNYASNPTFATDEAMVRYVDQVRQHSIYQIPVDVTPSDRLLTLATLGPGENTLVLFYRMVRDSENMGM